MDNKIRDVRTVSLDISFGELANKYRDEELIIQPNISRGYSDGLKGKRSRFIESLLLEMRIPPFFLIENDNGYMGTDRWIAEGFQHIFIFIGVPSDTAKDPSSGARSMVIIPELNNITYKELPDCITK